MQRVIGHVGDMGRHARNCEAFFGLDAFLQVPSATPVRVRHHGLSADLMERNILGRMTRGGGDGDRSENPFGISRGPLQNLHATH